MQKLQSFPHLPSKHGSVQKLPWHGSSPNGWTWSVPDVGSKHNPKTFNSLLAMQAVHRCGLAGASWSDPKMSSHLMYNDPDRDIPGLQCREDNSKPSKAEYVVMTKPCGISASLCKRYSSDRPPTAVTRLKQLEARGGRISAEPHLISGSGENSRIILPPRAHSTEPIAQKNNGKDKVEHRNQTSEVGAAPDLFGGQTSHMEASNSLPRRFSNTKSSSSRRTSVRSQTETIGSEKLVRFDASIDIGSSSLAKIDETRGEQPVIRIESLSLDERVQNIGRMLCMHMSQAVDAFLFLDVDGSGCLDADELCEGLDKLGIAVSHDEVEHLMATAKRNKDGKFQFKEFAEFFVGKFKPVTMDERRGKMNARNNITKFLMSFDNNSDGRLDGSELLAAFYAVDRDRDGWLSQEELQYALTNGEFGKGGKTDKKDAIETMIRLVMESDTNQDGKINYHEFLAMANLGNRIKDLDRQKWHHTASFGGAAQGFSGMNPFDAKVLARLRLLEGRDDDSSPPETPMGLVQWRKMYNQYYFGERYMSETDKQARETVRLRAEGKITDEKPMSYSRQKYVEQNLKSTPHGGGEAWKSTVSNAGYPNDWSTQTQQGMDIPFESQRLGKPPALDKVDQKGVNAGLQVPGTLNPTVDREKGPFRKTCLLPSSWEPYKDVAIRSSLGVMKHVNAAPAMLPPTYVAAQRHKTIKEVAQEAEHPEQADRPQSEAERRAMTAEESRQVFSRHGGRWSHHDTVSEIIVQKGNPPQYDSMVHETRPLIHRLPAQKTKKKPVREVNRFSIEETRHEISRLPEVDEDGDAAGLPSSYHDALEFHRPPIHKDLFGTTILKDCRAPLPFMHPMRVLERETTKRKRREAEKSRAHGGSERRRERAERAEMMRNMRAPSVAPQAPAPAEAPPPPDPPKADMSKLQAAGEKASQPMAQPLA